MKTAKRLRSTPPSGLPQTGGTSNRSGIQALHDPKHGPAAGSTDTTPVTADTAHFSRDVLVQALDEVSWTAEKQARVIEGLERLVQQLQRDMRKERLLNERSQKQMLNEQDEFIQQLISEHEEILTKVVAERDEALRQIGRLERLVPQSDASQQSPLPPTDEGGLRRTTTQEAVGLRQQLGLAKRRIGKLTSECRRSREVLHRVMRQRDEAQLAVAQLMHEIRESSPQHRWAEQASRHATTEPDSPSSANGVPAHDRDDAETSEAQTATDDPATTGDTGHDRKTPTASPSIHPSPLAIALASTHPERRRSRQRGGANRQRESTTLPGVAPEGRARPERGGSDGGEPE